jgi:hypothetical protein
MKKIIYNGQSRQDKFVCNILKHKTDGFFVEVGSQYPRRINNTYVLESSLGWKGLMFEWRREMFENLYKRHRPNSNHVFGDAQQHNYREIFNTYNAPQNIDYLQLDIEPAIKTLNVLKLLDEQVMNDYKFSVITFEHDYCHNKNLIFRNTSREILKNRGYHLVFGDICNKRPRWVYEDWYVHPDLVDMEYVQVLQSNNRSQYGRGFKEITSTLSWQDIIY